MKIISKSPQETQRLGREWGGVLRPGEVVALIGELGAGKTCLVQGLMEGLEVKDDYSGRSSTFVLINEYQGRLPVYHFDIYRLNNLREMAELGYEEYFYGKGVSIVEWADKAEGLLPPGSIVINIDIIGPEERRLEIVAPDKGRFNK